MFAFVFALALVFAFSFVFVFVFTCVFTGRIASSYLYLCLLAFSFLSAFVFAFVFTESKNTEEESAQSGFCMQKYRGREMAIPHLYAKVLRKRVRNLSRCEQKC